MEIITIVLVIIVVGLAGVAWKLYRDRKESEAEAGLAENEKNEKNECVVLGQGLAEYNQKLQERKNQAKEKIVAMLRERSKISNHDVARAMGISSSSVKRYFDELEAEGKARQVGNVGKYVYYSNM